MGFATYAKAWVGVFGAALSSVVAALSETGFDNLEGVNVALLVAGAVNVAITANVPGARAAKAIVAAIIAALTIVADLIATGGSWEHWPQMVVAVLTAAGVWAIPNADDPRHAAA